MEAGKVNLAGMEFIRKQIPEDDIYLCEPMKRHTTFRVGGEAECLLRISESRQLMELIPFFKEKGIPYFVLGNGSNLLVGDKGFPGIILQLGNRFNAIRTDGNQLTVQAGALMSQAARCAQQNGLSGLQFASGIPGTVGGGVVMNAGAYGGEMKQVVEKVTVMDDQGQCFDLSGAEMEFGYRSSLIKHKSLIVLEVTFRLQKGDSQEILAEMEELGRRRKEKQPLEFASAGSTFKRPEGNFAGKLIMDAGLRGYTVGGAQVSEKHCGFVINTGEATAAEVAQVIREVQKQVKDKTGISLETEVIFLGDFS